MSTLSTTITVNGHSTVVSSTQKENETYDAFVQRHKAEVEAAQSGLGD